MKSTYLLQQKQLVKVLELNQNENFSRLKKSFTRFKYKKSYNYINYFNIENFNL